VHAHEGFARAGLRNLDLVDGQRVDATRWTQANGAHHRDEPTSVNITRAKSGPGQFDRRCLCLAPDQEDRNGHGERDLPRELHPSSMQDRWSSICRVKRASCPAGPELRSADERRSKSGRLGPLAGSVGATTRLETGMGLDTSFVRRIASNEGDASLAQDLVSNSVPRSSSPRLDVASRILVGATRR